jgi:hypothetical protein
MLHSLGPIGGYRTGGMPFSLGPITYAPRPYRGRILPINPAIGPTSPTVLARLDRGRAPQKGLERILVNFSCSEFLEFAPALVTWHTSLVA